MKTWKPTEDRDWIIVTALLLVFFVSFPILNSWYIQLPLGYLMGMPWEFIPLLLCVFLAWLYLRWTLRRKGRFEVSSTPSGTSVPMTPGSSQGTGGGVLDDGMRWRCQVTSSRWAGPKETAWTLGIITGFFLVTFAAILFLAERELGRGEHLFPAFHPLSLLIPFSLLIILIAIAGYLSTRDRTQTLPVEFFVDPTGTGYQIDPGEESEAFLAEERRPVVLPWTRVASVTVSEDSRIITLASSGEENRVPMQIFCTEENFQTVLTYIHHKVSVPFTMGELHPRSRAPMRRT